MVASTAAAACTSGSSAAPSLGAIRSLLAAHAAAVRGDDAAAYSGDLAAGAASSAFRARQRSVIANLGRLRFASWIYVAPLRTDDRQAERAASAKYRRPAVIVRVTLRYALRGYDTRPAEEDLYWTFVEQGGRARIAGDTDLVSAGGDSWRGPWDFGELAAVRARDTIVLGHPAQLPLMRTAAAAIAAAVPAVTAVWGDDWPRRVVALVPASNAELAADVGETDDDLSAVSALAVSADKSTTTGAVSGQRLIVNPAQFDRLSALGRRIVVRHETTHIAAAVATSDIMPRWVVEGFAEYVGNLGAGQPTAVAASELRAQVRRAGPPQALPGDAAFDSTTAAQAYEEAWLACRLIAARAGQSGLVRFYRLVGSPSAPYDDPVGPALRSTLGESAAAFTAQWRRYVGEQLR
ncbi:hypothetical protein [uncultured Jatrophihabitans sp.]|uniref:hypothetical protein n=1 Tax=uncultured Jatrophihabitans sp. TaxID=1610747 RepID=UPI0035CAF367